MNGNPQPSITVNVDVTNPGQFFACCGLLELADRLWPGASVVGWFAPPRFQRSVFNIASECIFSVRDIMDALLDCDRCSTAPFRPILGSNGKPVADAKKIMPVELKGRFSLRLSWWLDELAGRQAAFKLWGAHQTSAGLLKDMCDAVKAHELYDANVLEYRVGLTGRIGLDTRSSWTALDRGFSPNDQNLPVDTFPATELLAAIGLETFKPNAQVGGYVYACWPKPLPVPVARAVACGVVDFHGVTRLHFVIGTRGKFKFFTKASLLERSTHG